MALPEEYYKNEILARLSPHLPMIHEFTEEVPSLLTDQHKEVIRVMACFVGGSVVEYQNEKRDAN